MKIWFGITVETNGAGMLCRTDMKRRLGRSLTDGDLATGSTLSPVIFLDMDGVISTRRAYLAQSGRPLPDRWIDGEAMSHLNTLCSYVGGVVVISSTWRLNSGRREFLSMLRRNGFAGQMHRRWRTCELSGIRGDEIAEWLVGEPACPYVILDDDSDFHPEQPLVKTDFEVGLTAAHVEAAISVLRRGLNSG